MIVKILDFFLEVDSKRKFNYIAIGCTGEVIAFEHKPVFSHEFSEWSYGNNRGDGSIIGNVLQRLPTDIAKSLCWELKDVDVTNDKFLRIDGFKVINVPKDIIDNYPYVAFKKVSEDITKVIFHQSEPVYYHDNLNSSGKTWEVYITGAVLKLEKEYYLTKDFVEDSAKYAFLIYHRKLLMLDEMQQTFNWVCISPGGNVCLTMERPKLSRTISDWEIENNSQIVMANYDAEDYHLSEMKLENLVVLQEAKTKTFHSLMNTAGEECVSPELFFIYGAISDKKYRIIGDGVYEFHSGDITLTVSMNDDECTLTFRVNGKVQSTYIWKAYPQKLKEILKALPANHG
jgi:hypothetical protein